MLVDEEYELTNDVDAEKSYYSDFVVKQLIYDDSNSRLLCSGYFNSYRDWKALKSDSFSRTSDYLLEIAGGNATIVINGMKNRENYNEYEYGTIVCGLPGEKLLTSTIRVVHPVLSL